MAAQVAKCKTYPQRLRVDRSVQLHSGSTSIPPIWPLSCIFLDRNERGGGTRRTAALHGDQEVSDAVAGWMGVASFAFLLSGASAAPVTAEGMVVIETVAQLSEHSDDGVKTAVLTAVETAARGAKAMGFTQIAVNGVRVLPKMVVVQVIAMDSSSGSVPDEQDQDDDAGSPAKGKRLEQL